MAQCILEPLLIYIHTHTHQWVIDSECQSICIKGGAEFAGPENVGPQKKWLEIATPGKWWTKSQGLENAGPGKWRTSRNQKLDTARFNTCAVNNKLVDRLLSGALLQRLVASPVSCLSPTVSVTHEYSDQYGEQRKRLWGFGKRSWILVTWKTYRS